MDLTQLVNIFVLLVVALGLGAVVFLYLWLRKQDAGTERMQGTETHAAAVIGDTFGDPLKDTTGPSLHILVKLQNIMSITLLPLFVQYGLNLFQ